MKKLGYLTAVVVLMMAVYSCTMGGSVSIPDRINDFMRDVNAGNYSSLYTHFHPTLTDQYNFIKPSAFWDSPGMFPDAERPSYVLGAIVPAGETVETIITSDAAYNNTSIKFDMAKDGDDYMIKSLTIGGVLKVW